MKLLEFDSREFPYPSSEEHLRLAVELKAQVPDLMRFLRNAAEDIEGILQTLPVAQSFGQCFWRGEIKELLAHFLPSLVSELDTSKIIALVHEQDAHSLLIETKSEWVLYEWSSAA